MDTLKRTMVPLVIIASTAGAVSGCRHSAPVQPPAPVVNITTPPPVSQPVTPVPDKPVLQPASYVPDAFNAGAFKEPEFTASVPDYSVAPDFKNIRNWKKFAAGFDADERRMLAKNLFLVLEADRHQMAFIYEENNYQANEKDDPTPSFITTDALLHTYHVFYDYLLRSIETNSLSPAASQMTRYLLEGALEQYAKADDESAKRAAMRNIAYLLVPAHALQCSVKDLNLPSAASTLADSEWKNVEQHSGQSASPIFGYKIDYSQFIPRGHYTRSETLKRYFIALMWYGNVPILVRDQSGTSLPDGVRQASLLGELFQPDAVRGAETYKLWKRIMDPTAFLVGNSDDFSPFAFVTTVKTAINGKQPELAVSSDTDLAAMVAAAEKASPTRMVNGMRSSEIGVKLMGQRFVLDGYVMQNLVLPDVGTFEKPRNHPMGLDVLASLGSKRAADLLTGVYNQNQFENFDTKLAKMTDYVTAIKPDTWKSNAYNGWLDVLRRLIEVKGVGYPSFMRNEAWVDKSLNAALGSWAELRHDTILYAKQTAVECGGEGGDDTREKPPGGYVEPDIKVYARLQYLLKQVTTGLDKLGMLDDSIKEPCKQFDDLLGLLVAVSRKELVNKPLSPEEDQTLKDFGDMMNRLNVFTTEVKVVRNGESFSETNMDSDRDMAVIADIHTDLFHNKVLEEAAGHANVIYAVFPAKGKFWIGRGAVFTYYEFEHPLSDRLTDEAWQKMLKSGAAPGQPVWIKSFQLHKGAPHGKLKIDDRILEDSRTSGGC